MTKINPTTTQYNKHYHPNFGWKKLCSGKVLQHFSDGRVIPLEVDICLLRAEDKAYISSLREKWGFLNTRYGGAIIKNFTEKTPAQKSAYSEFNYFMVRQSKGKKNENSFLSRLLSLFKKKKHQETSEPLCIAEVERRKKTFYLRFIQVSPNIRHLSIKQQYNFNLLPPLYKQERLERISGAGQMLTYGISLALKAVNSTLLKFKSTNDGFYRQIFHIDPGDFKGYCEADLKKLNRFIEETQHKYILKTDANTLPQELAAEINNNTFI